MLLKPWSLPRLHSTHKVNYSTCRKQELETMSRSLEGDDNTEAFMDEAIDISPRSSTNKLDKRPVPKGTPSPSAKVNNLLHDLYGIMLLPLGFKLSRNMCWNLEDRTSLILSSIEWFTTMFPLGVFNYVSCCNSSYFILTSYVKYTSLYIPNFGFRLKKFTTYFLSHGSRST
jgi:hypothetical protein